MSSNCHGHTDESVKLFSVRTLAEMEDSPGNALRPVRHHMTNPRMGEKSLLDLFSSGPIRAAGLLIGRTTSVPIRITLTVPNHLDTLRKLIGFPRFVRFYSWSTRLWVLVPFARKDLGTFQPHVTSEHQARTQIGCQVGQPFNFTWQQHKAPFSPISSFVAKTYFTLKPHVFAPAASNTLVIIRGHIRIEWQMHRMRR